MISSTAAGEPADTALRIARGLGAAFDIVGIVGAEIVVDSSAAGRALAGRNTHADSGSKAATRAWAIHCCMGRCDKCKNTEEGYELHDCCEDIVRMRCI
jgi:hypothetical protein